MKKNNYLSFFIFLNSTFLIQRSIILECTETVNLVGESVFFSIRIEANANGNEVLRLISYELGHHVSPPQSTEGTPAGQTWGQLRGQGEAIYSEFLWNKDLVEGRGGQVCSVQEAATSPNNWGLTPPESQAQQVVNQGATGGSVPNWLGRVAERPMGVRAAGLHASQAANDEVWRVAA
jgi:hypothetical protein